MNIQLIDLEKEISKPESLRRSYDIVYIDDCLLRTDNSTIELKSCTGILGTAGVGHRTYSEEPAVFLIFRHKQTACNLA